MTKKSILLRVLVLAACTILVLLVFGRKSVEAPAEVTELKTAAQPSSSQVRSDIMVENIVERAKAERARRRHAETAARNTAESLTDDSADPENTASARQLLEEEQERIETKLRETEDSAEKEKLERYNDALRQIAKTVALPDNS